MQCSAGREGRPGPGQDEQAAAGDRKGGREQHPPRHPPAEKTPSTLVRQPSCTFTYPSSSRSIWPLMMPAPQHSSGGDGGRGAVAVSKQQPVGGEQRGSGSGSAVVGGQAPSPRLRTRVGGVPDAVEQAAHMQIARLACERVKGQGGTGTAGGEAGDPRAGACRGPSRSQRLLAAGAGVRTGLGVAQLEPLHAAVVAKRVVNLGAGQGREEQGSGAGARSR